ncbi:hypothetical protein PPYR_11877 [Photinus pyralis]|uniref:Uncharacterized protein n=1 Tax=Photinus pyralis TaxID=7054 RepID=A0A1Y1KSW5_PHOPY|nr:uncharacterized protein LOC116176708 [Photinus pyralis]XP_031358622.1 uncharacterized protein LOC116182242 [Photinus pyralis]KAB0790359.1 hypothetical protein PPYR_15274 [Photinus pyralis]KAB0795038.1 hypothetical protein PPYR_11877 [Photinus pyralis]
MKLFLSTCAFMLGVVKIDGRCANILSDEEQACAKPLKLDATSVLEFYQSRSDSTIFSEYINCVWVKWNFINENGEILFKNIMTANGLPWKISRICEDVGQLIEKAEKEFKNSVKYCAKNPPVPATAISVMRCIDKNYKPTPVEDSLKN